MNQENIPATPISGMTLRDFFAAAALQGFLTKGLSMMAAVQYSYEAADQMLIERDKIKE